MTKNKKVHWGKRIVDFLAAFSVIAEIIILPLWLILGSRGLPTGEWPLSLVLLMVNGPVSIVSSVWVGFRNRERTKAFFRRHPNINLQKIGLWIVGSFLSIKLLSFLMNL